MFDFFDVRLADALLLFSGFFHSSFSMIPIDFRGISFLRFLGQLLLLWPYRLLFHFLIRLAGKGSMRVLYNCCVRGQYRFLGDLYDFMILCRNKFIVYIESF